MADSMNDVNIKHTLKRCDEIREKYVANKSGWWDETTEPHLIEIRTDDLTNDHVEESHAEKVADIQKYDIIKFLERANGVILEEKTVFFNVDRLQKDLLLSSVLKPTTVRRREDAEHMNVLNKRFKAKLSA